MNYSVLRGKMAEAGYTQGRLAQEIGIAPQSLSRKLKGKRQFTVGEAALLCGSWIPPLLIVAYLGIIR